MLNIGLMVPCALRKESLKWLFCVSVAQSCPTLRDPMDCSMPGSPVHHQLLELAQTHVHRVGDAIQRSRLLLSPFLPSVFPSIRVFSNESALHIRWPKYWSFNFSISPSVNIQDWFSLWLTGLISLLSRGISRVFFNKGPISPVFKNTESVL